MKKMLLIVVISLMVSLTTQAQNLRSNYLRRAAVEKKSGTATQVENTREVTCDTIRFPMSGTITYYYLADQDTGYVTGNNSYGDKAKAEYYEAAEEGYVISGFVAEFAIAKSISNSNADITFGIWDNTGTNGNPGNMVASATYPLNWIIEDIEKQWLTIVNIDEPYTPTGPFYVGIVLPQTPGDTVALWCRESADSYTGTAWDMWNDNTWHAFTEAGSWKLNTSMLIHPIVCKTLGFNKPVEHEISVLPNPSNGMISIQIRENTPRFRVEIYAYNGSRILSKAFTNGNNRVDLDLSWLPKGIYVIKIYDHIYHHSQKIILN